MARRPPAKRYFGTVRTLPSGRHQARYTGPDGVRYTAQGRDGRPLTFDTRGDAEAWLSLRHSELLRGEWLPPRPASAPAAPLTLRTYGAAWLAERDIETRTREHYAQLLRDHIYPTFGDQAVTAVTPAAVRTWHADLACIDAPVARAHAYALLKAIFKTAVDDDLVGTNPCRIRGAGQAKTKKKVRPASLEELATIVAALPARYQMMAQLACWCSLRSGELRDLHRADVDLKAGLLYVRTAVVQTKERGLISKEPKSEAGKRPVTIPPHVVDGLREHLRLHVGPERTALLFSSRTGGHMAASSFQRVFERARGLAGREDLTLHDLRHTGQSFAALNGANLRELMARAGQSTPSAALRYIHELDGRQKEIADRLSDFAAASNVTPIQSAGPARARRTNKAATARKSGQADFLPGPDPID